MTHYKGKILSQRQLQMHAGSWQFGRTNMAVEITRFPTQMTVWLLHPQVRKKTNNQEKRCVTCYKCKMTRHYWNKCNEEETVKSPIKRVEFFST